MAAAFSQQQLWSSPSPHLHDSGYHQTALRSVPCPAHGSDHKLELIPWFTAQERSSLSTATAWKLMWLCQVLGAAVEMGWKP